MFPLSKVYVFEVDISIFFARDLRVFPRGFKGFEMIFLGFVKVFPEF